MGKGQYLVILEEMHAEARHIVLVEIEDPTTASRARSHASASTYIAMPFSGPYGYLSTNSCW